LKVFRITKARHTRTAFSGEGARLAGGRWTYPGEAAVYCSSTLALAALETFVHVGEEGRTLAFASFEVNIPASVRFDRMAKPPRGWREEPPGPASMRVGSHWLREHRSVALALPSVLVPQEFNVILNPAHSDFSRLEISRPRRFAFDPRMWK
jgi:RES domain-containing protein